MARKDPTTQYLSCGKSKANLEGTERASLKLREKVKHGPSRSIEGILVECRDGTRKILPEQMRTESAVMDMFYTRLNLEMAVDGWWSNRVVELLKSGNAEEIRRVEQWLKE